MYLFEDGNEYKIDKFSNFKYLVKEHKYFKIAEPLVNYFKDKECVLCSNGGFENIKDFDEFKFIFEEINITEEEIEALKVLGKQNSIQIKRNVSVITLSFRLKNNSCFKCDSIIFTIRNYIYFGYYDEFKNHGKTGYYRKQKDLDFTIIFNNPDEIFYSSYSMFYPANMSSICSIYNAENSLNCNLKKYSRRFIKGMLYYLENEYNTKIYSDVLRDLNDPKKSNCPITISELKNYRTKKDLFYGKYNKVLQNVTIPKNYFNTHSFLDDYYIILFLKTFGKNLINIIVSSNEYLKSFNNYVKKKDKVYDILEKILYKRFGNYNMLSSDIVLMLRNMPASKRKKVLPESDILCSKEKLKNYHDRLIDLFDEKDIRNMSLNLNKKQEKLIKDKQKYEELSKRLPENWHMFSNEKELIHESHIMQNCIKTYAASMLNADCGLFWGEKNGRRYNAEIVYDKKNEKYKIIQLFGFNNCKPVKSDVSDFIKSINNINKEIKEKKEIG